MKSTYEKIYEQVRRIPRGKVATYGQIALLCGMPGRAREVGYALHQLKPGNDIPWHRVVNALGEISLPAYEGGGSLQKQLLLDEGIEFNHRGKIALETFGWRD